MPAINWIAGHLTKAFFHLPGITRHNERKKAAATPEETHPIPSPSNKRKRAQNDETLSDGDTRKVKSAKVATETDMSAQAVAPVPTIPTTSSPSKKRKRSQDETSGDENIRKVKSTKVAVEQVSSAFAPATPSASVTRAASPSDQVRATAAAVRFSTPDHVSSLNSSIDTDDNVSVPALKQQPNISASMTLSAELNITASPGSSLPPVSPAPTLVAPYDDDTASSASEVTLVEGLPQSQTTLGINRSSGAKKVVRFSPEIRLSPPSPSPAVEIEDEEDEEDETASQASENAQVLGFLQQQMDMGGSFSTAPERMFTPRNYPFTRLEDKEIVAAVAACYNGSVPARFSFWDDVGLLVRSTDRSPDEYALRWHGYLNYLDPKTRTATPFSFAADEYLYSLVKDKTWKSRPKSSNMGAFNPLRAGSDGCDWDVIGRWLPSPRPGNDLWARWEGYLRFMTEDDLEASRTFTAASPSSNDFTGFDAAPVRVIPGVKLLKELFSDNQGPMPEQATFPPPKKRIARFRDACAENKKKLQALRKVASGRVEKKTAQAQRPAAKPTSTFLRGILKKSSSPQTSSNIDFMEKSSSPQASPPAVNPPPTPHKVRRKSLPSQLHLAGEEARRHDPSSWSPATASKHFNMNQSLMARLAAETPESPSARRARKAETPRNSLVGSIEDLAKEARGPRSRSIR